MKYSDKCERLSHSEHTARAMLLGRVYDWRDGTYGYLTEAGDGVRGDGLLDADTLEPLDVDGCNRRIRERFGIASLMPNWTPERPKEPGH